MSIVIIHDLQVKRRKVSLRVPFKTALRTATEIENIEVSLTLENGMIGKGQQHQPSSLRETHQRALKRL